MLDFSVLTGTGVSNLVSPQLTNIQLHFIILLIVIVCESYVMVVKSRLAVPHRAVGPPADIVAKLSLDRLTLFCHTARGVILALSQGCLPGKFSLPLMVKLTIFCHTARGVILAV